VALIAAYLAKCDPKLLESRTQVGPVAETQKAQQVIQSIAGLLFIGLFIVPGLDFRFHWSVVPSAVSWIANGFVAIRALEEEKFLAANLTGYDAYRQKVRYRLIRHVW
jgi:protein-S-isoprenylcysteine O-methyltransferase Ste14